MSTPQLSRFETSETTKGGNLPASHEPCPVCQKPVRVIAQPLQRHRHLADHGPKLGELCAGSGKLA